MAAAWIFLPASLLVIALGLAFSWLLFRFSGLDPDGRRAEIGLAA